ncbi:MAG: sugar phosphorylase [bacterium]
MIPVLHQHALRHVQARFERLYGPLAPRCHARFSQLLGRYGIGCPEPAAPRRWDERDAVLITYGDSVCRSTERPLVTLGRFLERYVGDAVNTVHILPFFPFSSDDGFSVVHFRTVHPDLGGWNDVQALGGRYRLMFDLVLNHVSRASNWFRDFELGIAPGCDFFIAQDPATDLTAVVRPRTHPLLTPVNTRDGLRHVWTTFSDDQVDLNYANPDVLFDMLDILIFYISMGARIVRLDAIAYLWKKPGTPCIHLPEAHEVVKLMRDLLDIVAPDVLLLTETNVPHEENVSYFGQGDEAHLVYQFSLPPLLLHTMVMGNAARLTQWAAGLSDPPPGCSHLNFTASHDGIGVRPLEGLVPAAEIGHIVEHVQRRGGRVSMKKNSDGTESPYELNCTWFDAMGGEADEAEDLHLARFLCSQAIPLALKGIPAVYIHSLTATPNDLAGVEQTGRARTINRRKWDDAALQALLDDKASAASCALRTMVQMLKVRAQHAAFHPDGAQRVLDLDARVFAVERIAPGGTERIVALHNVSSEQADVRVSGLGEGATDLLGGTCALTEGGAVKLPPYASAWLAQAS